MIHLIEEIEKIKLEGYSEANAEARLCQDIILCGIANSPLRKNVTIKGGVVMRNVSKNARRATLDIDIDFLRYSISDDSIRAFFGQLRLEKGLILELMEPISELKHQDYKGKRAFVKIRDSQGHELDSKIDIGVHKDLDILQEEYCFDICFRSGGVCLLANSCEQVFTEKVKSFLRFGTHSTRYKDIFDIYYLIKHVNLEKLKQCMKRYIFKDKNLPVNNFKDIAIRMETVLGDERFLTSVIQSKKNWTSLPTEEVFQKCLAFINSLVDV